MKKNIVVKILSILASLLFPLTALIGMLFGQIGSRIFVETFSFGYGQVAGEFIFFTISGYCAGYFSAFVISKIYKNFNFNFTLIIPILVMIYFGYVNILEATEVSLSYLVNSLARDVVMLGTFYYILRGYSLKNN
jgi:hypothetical protein